MEQPGSIVDLPCVGPRTMHGRTLSYGPTLRMTVSYPMMPACWPETSAAHGMTRLSISILRCFSSRPKLPNLCFSAAGLGELYRSGASPAEARRWPAETKSFRATSAASSQLPSAQPLVQNKIPAEGADTASRLRMMPAYTGLALT